MIKNKKNLIPILSTITKEIIIYLVTKMSYIRLQSTI